jgi:hypothetical protein
MKMKRLVLIPQNECNAVNVEAEGAEKVWSIT